MNLVSFFADILSSLFERKLGLVNRVEDDNKPIDGLCQALLSSRGDVSGMSLAQLILDRYADLDDAGKPRRSAEAEQERAIAIYDILEDNIFRLESQAGPFHLTLRLEGRHVHFDIRQANETPLIQFFMAMGPLRRVMRDYFHVCDTYYDAIRTKSPSQIQAIDMGRRALHNEGSELLQARLEGKVETDFQTARRLFTLICVLQSR